MRDTNFNQKTIILLSCGKSKQKHPCEAEKMYTGTIFKKSFLVAKKLKPDAIYILSAEYGLLSCKEVIKPYNLSLNTFSKKQKKNWANKVVRQLEAHDVTADDRLIFFTGKNYREQLMNSYPNSRCPIAGLRLGEQIQFYNKFLKK